MNEPESAMRADELIHLPDEPAGVTGPQRAENLAMNLAHLPGKPAGVDFCGAPQSGSAIQPSDHP
jgi:hypothetical protein